MYVWIWLKTCLLSEDPQIVIWEGVQGLLQQEAGEEGKPQGWQLSGAELIPSQTIQIVNSRILLAI